MSNPATLSAWQQEMRAEFEAIADWWLEHVICLDSGDIAAEVSADNKRNRKAGKSLVYSARLLWFFSAAFRFRPDPRFRAAADLCYRELTSLYPDRRNGGLVWSVDAAGLPDSRKKQCYGLCFAVYALTEYFMATGHGDAIVTAEDLVCLVERNMYDTEHGGYIEAMTPDWRTLEDMRLGDTDLNAEKTMNTHLHVLEAWINFHRAQPGAESAARLARVADLFLQHFVASGGYQKRFFTRDWQELPAEISFGHDIEASWLLWEAGAVLDNGALRGRLLGPVVELADSVLESGAGPEGEVFHEGTQREAVDRSRIWWVQAEALVGFMNAWQVTADERFLEASRASWAFIRDYQRDTEYGEWAWYSRLDRAAPPIYKAGFWKAPYHNGRAMLEMIRRLSAGRNA